jgi:hypothetical protein
LKETMTVLIAQKEKIVRRVREDIAPLNGVTPEHLKVCIGRLRLRPGLRAVLSAMADHYPNIRPSVKTLAASAGITERPTHTNLRVLESMGYIKTLPRERRKGGPGNTVQYLMDAKRVLVEGQY